MGSVGPKALVLSGFQGSKGGSRKFCLGIPLELLLVSAFPLKQHNKIPGLLGPVLFGFQSNKTRDNFSGPSHCILGSGDGFGSVEANPQKESTLKESLVPWKSQFSPESPQASLKTLPGNRNKQIPVKHFRQPKHWSGVEGAP